VHLSHLVLAFAVALLGCSTNLPGATFSENAGGALGAFSIIKADGTGDYTSLAAAGQDFSQWPGGAAGDYTFYVASDTNESTQAAFGNATNGYTISIRPLGGLRTVQFTGHLPNLGQEGHLLIGASISEQTLAIVKTDGFLIDGQLPGLDQALTFQNIETMPANSSTASNPVINVVGDSDWMRIKNCTVKNKAANWLGTIGIMFTGTLDGAGEGVAPDFGLIGNCAIETLGLLGTGIVGNSKNTEATQRDLHVLGCSILASTRGIGFNSSSSGAVEDCRIAVRSSQSNNLTGIQFAKSGDNSPVNFRIRRNSISLVSEQVTPGSIYIGLLLGLTQQYHVSSYLEVANNMITLSFPGTSYNMNSIRGISASPVFGRSRILYNSIWIQKPPETTVFFQNAMAIGTLSSVALKPKYEIFNNIIRNDIPGVPMLSLSDYYTLQSDGNVWSAPGPGPLVKRSSTEYATLSEWQSARGQDTQTVIYNPVNDWVTTSDLHLRSRIDAIPPAIADARTADRLFDFDLQSRHLFEPQRGADEVVPASEADLSTAVVPTLFVHSSPSRRVRSRQYLKTSLLVKNMGATGMKPVRVQYVLSNDATPDSSDQILRNILVCGLRGGNTKRIRMNIAVAGSTSGKYLIAVLDPSRTIVPGESSDRISVVGPLP